MKIRERAGRKRFLVFGAPAIQGAEIREVVSTIKSGWLSTGPRVHRFEEAFKALKRKGYPVAVSSCTAALHLSLVAAGVGPGDEVITTALTFCATVNPIIHVGATPVLADVDPATMNIDPVAIAARITPRTRAIIPVHFAGRPCDMEAIVGIAKRHGLKLIEDCAHAVEAEYRGDPCGSFGDFGCFSFYVTKNVMTGEGGMVLCRRREDAERIKVLSLQGMSRDAWKRFGGEGYKHYQVIEPGYKYNMMDIQAALGIHQLARWRRNWEKRKSIWQHYQKALAFLPVTRPQDPEPRARHSYHLYTLRVDESCAGVSRDDFLEAMTRQNIGVGVHYLSIPEHPYYQRAFGWRPEDYPHAMRIGRETVSLPLSPKLTARDVDDVIRAVRRALGVGSPSKRARK